MRTPRPDIPFVELRMHLTERRRGCRSNLSRSETVSVCQKRRGFESWRGFRPSASIFRCIALMRQHVLENAVLQHERVEQGGPGVQPYQSSEGQRSPCVHSVE